ncbi:MAG: shikimate dehydrogenase [Nitriliruptoraceae bacterium]|nr:shikimate dehydrogenase [Nitriliruptoraceae bacterium]
MSRDAAGGWPTAATRAVVLLGHPAGHSLSPPIHNAAFAADGLDLIYLAWDVPPAGLSAALETLVATGAVGANVTVPHKRAVFEACAVRSEEADLIGAVNTLRVVDGSLHGDNTDARGLLDAWRQELDDHLDGGLEGVSALVLGTGGAARATAVALGRRGAEVVVAGRREAAVADLVALAGAAGARAADGVLVDDAAALAERVAAARLVVNATPLGMGGEDLPAPLMALRADQVASDLVYDPIETPFLAAARRAGALTQHGLGMLLGQAARSYAIWTGRPAPREVMATALEAALAARSRA